jgi:hypothetical protein
MNISTELSLSTLKNGATLLAATALAMLVGCQSAAENQRLPTETEAADLANCAQIREVSDNCGGRSGATSYYVDNMHKNRTVRATVRKHSQEGDEDTDYAIAGGGQLFIGCGSSGTNFAVVGCELLKAETEER